MRLGHVCIIVKDMRRSLEFYRDAMGLQVIIDDLLPNDEMFLTRDLETCTLEPGGRFRNLVLTDDEGSSLELHEWFYPVTKESPPEHLRYRTTGIKEVAWNVPDLDEVVKKLAEKGFAPRTPIWTYRTMGVETRSVLYFDPDGVTVQFVELPRA